MISSCSIPVTLTNRLVSYGNSELAHGYEKGNGGLLPRPPAAGERAGAPRADPGRGAGGIRPARLPRLVDRRDRPRRRGLQGADLRALPLEARPPHLAARAPHPGDLRAARDRGRHIRSGRGEARGGRGPPPRVRGEPPRRPPDAVPRPRRAGRGRDASSGAAAGG